MHKLGDVFHKLEAKRFFSLPCSRKTGHYTFQQIQNSHGERHGSSSSSGSGSTPLLVPKPSSASYPGCRSRPSSSPRHSPNFRSRLQPACRRCNSQVDSKSPSGCEQFHGGSASSSKHIISCWKIKHSWLILKVWGCAVSPSEASFNVM